MGIQSQNPYYGKHHRTNDIVFTKNEFQGEEKEEEPID